MQAQSTSCGCSDDYGPCERHGVVLVVRQGAALHTGDELTMLLIEDLVDVGAELSATGKFEHERLSAELERCRNEYSGNAWFEDPDDAGAADDLAFQLEQYVADLYVIKDDGYVIVRPTDDCPLS